ncbi:MAG TPA: DUF3179 domain-containing (seleno)protein [Cyclobacteriaceae bacterium]|jgi:hypothetical protein|nr:DUF3179 domain-containing (seleno)protein [Cyclobacteriaceae bacterium]
MKKFFYIGAIGLALFEIANVYFIMPMPGSQRMNSINVAYFLYSYRWFFRVIFSLMIAYGSLGAFKRKWILVTIFVITMAIVYLFNFVMVADHMFKEPTQLSFQSKDGNRLNDSSMVVAVENNGEVKAYPIRFIVYHHQVQDVIGGKPMIITYCSVCRTGRVYEPVVKGKHEKFRLVGMDHFNAMFEDETTKSWWRQVNGEAITGSLKGEALPEVESVQLSVGKLFELYPNAKVMQLDEVSRPHYDTLGGYEHGKSRGILTRTDSLSWNEKSWVVGLQVGKSSKAYDWNKLKEVRIINDKVGDKSIVLALSNDNQSFVAFERSSDAEIFAIRNDTLITNDKKYNFSGRDANAQQLKKINAYQEFWHSWRTFHPQTEQFK